MLTPVALLELGNAASMLLILRATDLLQTGGREATVATSLAIVLYAAHNGAASLAAIGGGHLADRFTAREVFMGGAVAYVIGYTVFAVGGSGGRCCWRRSWCAGWGSGSRRPRRPRSPR